MHTSRLLHSLRSRAALASELDELAWTVYDPGISDVFIDEDCGLWTIARSGRRTRHDAARVPPERLRALAVGLIAAGGRHLDVACPLADVVVADGVRVHAVLGSAGVAGTSISIRLPRIDPVTLDDVGVDPALGPAAELRALIRDDPALGPAAELRALIRDDVDSRRTTLVTGATGSGKTALLSALLAEVPAMERIVSLEDVAELTPDHPQHIVLRTRQANADGAGAIGIDELLVQALRMRPDRLVVGECRGTEAVDMLMAFTTGHAGGGSTLHAPSIDDVPSRLSSLCSRGGLAPAATAELALSAIDRVVHVRAVPGGSSISGYGRPRPVPGGWRVEPLPIEPSSASTRRIASSPRATTREPAHAA
ncbi:CpaF family protein [Mycetocola reblochoni]|nr:ATPase, T2SS/T4P/T4SS family [Mycetocola reblochoni]